MINKKKIKAIKTQSLKKYTHMIWYFQIYLNVKMSLSKRFP